VYKEELSLKKSFSRHVSSQKSSTISKYIHSFLFFIDFEKQLYNDLFEMLKPRATLLKPKSREADKSNPTIVFLGKNDNEKNSSNQKGGGEQNTFSSCHA
jgi:hypothetical protein